MNQLIFSKESIEKHYDQRKLDYSKLILTARKYNPRKLDEIVHALHIEVFEKIDCLTCGNCCLSLGPRISEKDIAKMAKYLRIKETELIDTYLKVDEDKDYIFRTMPCPFLGIDNYCSIYESRPKACREYPHTDRKKFYQLLNLSFKNARTCPAVQEIFDKLKVEIIKR